MQTDPSLPADVELARVFFVRRRIRTTWGVLLQSPEPIDWDRASLRVLRFVHAGPPWRIATHRAIRDADGTRAILLLVSGGTAMTWPFGRWRVDGTYKRNAGSDLPTLSEAGVSTDETGSTSIVLQ